jgi:hypothetical protein
VSDPACLPESKCKGKKILQLPLKAPDRALLTVLMSKFPDFDSSSGSEDIRCGSKYVILYLGQPLSEYKIINKRDEIALIQRAVNCVSGDEVIVYIKLHPREDVEKYSSLKGSVKYITSGIPAELVMSFLQPHLVISAWSSAGVVVEKWFNKKVIYLIKLIQNCNKLPNSEDALFDNAPITWAEFERTVQLCVVEKDVHATKVIDSDARNTYALFTDSLLNS